ncbi:MULTISPECIES: arsenate reductase (glutaredoxin) [unclassified Paludibacterium]|uniref:arsenate reductase (glutaredoxin) n=1 Tax=unclassified Paludibacterium TaxID=2618429 RepID=UPI001C050C54|nr:arsenate reductase (glutaredoxin) [Paludibacterium sp. B53371]BEV73128.1 arsenate reductase (glutaredoxin) [Paludibacterium sp. THUN1379]
MIRFYHNPRCSKSREALQLLQEKHVELEIIDYLKHPLQEAELAQLLSLLEMDARALLRRKEPEYAELHLDDVTLESKHLIRVMIEHPRLMERPIAASETRAVIGRPPENVLTLLSA